MKDRKFALKGTLATTLSGIAVATALWTAAMNGTAQTPPPSLPPGVQDVLKLAHAGMGDDVILTQIKNAGASYNLNADQILYLNSQGVSQAVIKSLISGGAPAAPAAVSPISPTAPPPIAPPATVPPAGTVPPPTDPNGNFAYFHAQLGAYGSWIDLPGYGQVWRPTITTEDPLWRPYADAGHWIYTDNGWFWQSDYPWGEIAFHYGRWLRRDSGWVWVPGNDWAPAWVSWRRTDRYCGWAPLPPTAVFKADVGLTFDGAVAVDTDFGLSADAFTFVPYDHFWDLNLRPFVLSRDRVGPIFRDSIVLNGYRFDHGRFIVDGLGRDYIARFTHHDVRIEVPIFRDDRLRPGNDRLFGPDHLDDHRLDDHRSDDRRPNDRRPDDHRDH